MNTLNYCTTMMRNLYLLHGIHARANNEHTGLFKAHFPNAQKRDYGHIMSFQALWVNRALAESLADEINDRGESIILGHSNGCAIASRVAELSPNVIGLVMINAALDSFWEPPSTLKWMLVYYHPKDIAVKLAKIIPFTRWGDMGAVGAKSISTNTVINNYNLDNWGYAYHGLAGAHNIVWQKFQYYGPIITRHIHEIQREVKNYET